ncbi:sulfurtransferase TusA family protein [Nocardiopsis metallicus]|uniref:tRNA 2-thiouridine synthesizing protein A n=1 Tax=Nocardiopsis metallicus TaxID=179819 RepID=A0A840WEA4_9ACTN|nr:sulfurtransferase TusA family protein [Nocardiopsis metallicus]MBB5494542.1 tRNA 2-thiouridine synthesizing protein A [Nocardiopsis metallicus]
MNDVEEEPVVVDGGDRSCVRLLLELRDRVQELPPGTVVHLFASDPAAPLDLPAWCHLTGHTYLGPARGYGRPAYGLRVTQAPRTTRPDAPWHPAS